MKKLFIPALLAIPLLMSCSNDNVTSNQAGKLTEQANNLSAVSSNSSLRVIGQASNLLVDDIVNPLNIHSQNPKLSWYVNAPAQAYYQIQVATSAEKLAANTPDLWDSGKVKSEQSINIPYQGKKLSTNDIAFWRVKHWANDAVIAGNAQSAKQNTPLWSNINRWEMGLLEKSDWQAKWVQVANPVISEKTPAVDTWMTYATGLQENNIDGMSKGKRKIQERVFVQLQKEPTASYFRHQFSIPQNKKIIKAKLHSTAAGYYEIYLNGERVEDRLMDPGQTDYDKRILYNSDEVSPLINTGKNTIAVHLGSGWYSEDVAFSHWKNPDAKPAEKTSTTSSKKKEKPNKNLSYGQPKFIAQLELFYSDGSNQIVTSNEEWLSHPSPVLKEGLFSGELFDASQTIKNWNNTLSDVSQWQAVQALAQWPTKTLEPQLLPAIRAVTKLTPKKIFNPKQDVWVFDFKQNFTGIPTINLESLGLKKGQVISFRYGEWADAKGNMSQKSGGGAPLLKQVDTYVASGADDKTWTPSFTWHGFRYVEVTGLTEKPTLDSISGELLRSDVERVGLFTSSDPLLNRIHDLALWSYEGNLMAVPMDCPIRERAGWTGDAHAALITGNYNFNMQNFWQKYLGDFKTSKHIAPAIVPGKRSHGGNFDWAVAEVMIAWEHYRHHGNIQVLASQYDSMLEYMDAAENKLTNGLLRIGYGDWCDPVLKTGMGRKRCNPQHTKPTITSSALFANAANLMSKMSTLLGKPEEAAYYQRLYNNVSAQFNKEFYDEKTGDYGSQTADAMALTFGITPLHLRQSVADALNKDVTEKWNGHGSVGAIGQTYLYLALSDYGYGDTAFNIFKAEGYPGYAYQLDTLNATTLWERKGSQKPEDVGRVSTGRSLNHPFHSGYDGWFYEGLGGIRPLDDNPGFQHFALNPVFVSDLDSVNVSYKTGYGNIKSSWKRINNSVTWDFEIPNNSTAVVTMPNKEKVLHTAGKYTLIYR